MLYCWFEEPIQCSHLALRFQNFCQCSKAALPLPKGQYMGGCKDWAWVLKVMSKKTIRISACSWNQATGERKEFWKNQSLTAHLKSGGYGLNNLLLLVSSYHIMPLNLEGHSWQWYIMGKKWFLLRTWWSLSEGEEQDSFNLLKKLQYSRKMVKGRTLCIAGDTN